MSFKTDPGYVPVGTATVINPVTAPGDAAQVLTDVGPTLAKYLTGPWRGPGLNETLEQAFRGGIVPATVLTVKVRTGSTGFVFIGNNVTSRVMVRVLEETSIYGVFDVNTATPTTVAVFPHASLSPQTGIPTVPGTGYNKIGIGAATDGRIYFYNDRSYSATLEVTYSQTATAVASPDEWVFPFSDCILNPIIKAGMGGTRATGDLHLIESFGGVLSGAVSKRV